MFLILKKIIRFYKFYKGPFNKWSEAKKKSYGYNHKKIIHRVFKIAKQARKINKFEKDGFLLNNLEDDKIISEYLKKGKNLNIIDFGGGFGTLHNQYKKFLKNKRYNWFIIEQKKYVELGRKFFNEKNLFFLNDLTKYKFKVPKINLVIFSSSIQYIENYQLILNKIIQIRPDFIIFLKTPLSGKDDNRIYVQNIPQNFYEGSYPSWVFSKKYLTEFFTKRYYLLNSYTVEPKMFLVNHYNIYFKVKK